MAFAELRCQYLDLMRTITKDDHKHFNQGVIRDKAEMLTELFCSPMMLSLRQNQTIQGQVAKKLPVN